MPPRRKQSREVHAPSLRKEDENTQEEIMKRDEWHDREHQRNLRTFKELALRIVKGALKIMSITIDKPQFGHTRVVIFFHDTKE
jgi:hypothetical protein